ncbi:MAG: right-handed parallel beta-helix repeat-containing protein [Candidatus Acidiferrales bacterium]
MAISGPFVSAGNTLPTTLSVGQSMMLKVTFTPTAAGAASGTLTITSNAGNSPTKVALTGNEATCKVTFYAGDDLPGIVNAYPPDTTFCFSSGTYRMTSYVTPKSNDAFIGLSSGAILSGSQLVTSWAQSGNYWVTSNQPKLIPQTRDVCATSTSPACQFPDALFLDNTPLSRVMSLSAVVPGTFYRDYASKQIYVADNPTGHTMEVIVSSLPFLAVGTGADGVTIEGLTIEKFAGNAQGAVQGSATWTIQNNEVRLNHGDGIEANGKILGNYLHDNGDFGLEGGYATTAMDVENNEFAFNNWANFANGGGAKFEYATNLVVRNNYAHDNNGAGLHTDGDSANVLYEYNHTKNNLNFGIEHEISWEAIIRYNLLENETAVSAPHLNNTIWARPAIGIFNSSDVQVYGNTITNSANGIGAVLVNRGNSNHAPNTGQPYLLKNLDVHDNTFNEITYEAAGLVRTSDFDTSVYTSWNNHFTNNTYNLADLSGLYFVWMDSSGKNSYAPHTWVEWQSFGNDVGGAFQASNP